METNDSVPVQNNKNKILNEKKEKIILAVYFIMTYVGLMSGHSNG